MDSWSPCLILVRYCSCIWKGSSGSCLSVCTARNAPSETCCLVWISFVVRLFYHMQENIDRRSSNVGGTPGAIKQDGADEESLIVSGGNVFQVRCTSDFVHLLLVSPLHEVSRLTLVAKRKQYPEDCTTERFRLMSVAFCRYGYTFVRPA